MKDVLSLKRFSSVVKGMRSAYEMNSGGSFGFWVFLSLFVMMDRVLCHEFEIRNCSWCSETVGFCRAMEEDAWPARRPLHPRAPRELSWSRGCSQPVIPAAPSVSQRLSLSAHSMVKSKRR